MTQTNNPLGQYFRKPGLNVKLPSGGQFYKNPPKISVDGEIAVYPMTAKDELLVKNADSLLNGDALVNLIRSCVPDIVDPKEMPNPDVDAILLAIRKATYGDSLEVTTTCPCGDWNGTYSVSVDRMLIKIKDIATRNEVELDNNLTVVLKPSTLSDQNKLGLVQFENVRRLQAVMDSTDEEIKMKASSDVTNRNIQLASEIISSSILSVLTPDGQEVSDNAAIREWLSQLEATEYKKIEDAMRIINDSGADTKIEVICGKEGCDRKFEVEFTLDPVSFFAPGS
jgi:hypothetical protein